MGRRGEADPRRALRASRGTHRVPLFLPRVSWLTACNRRLARDSPVDAHKIPASDSRTEIFPSCVLRFFIFVRQANTVLYTFRFQLLLSPRPRRAQMRGSKLQSDEAS